MEKDIDIALFVLKSGGVILYPTETVWGLGCDATNEDAVNQLKDIKSRPDSKGMLVLVDDPKMIKDYVEEIPPKAIEILKESDGPTTIIYPKAKNLAGNILADDGSIGIRVTTNEFCKTVIRKLGKPIVSTSANTCGNEPPKSFKDISVNLVCDVDYVVKFDQDTIIEGAKPSRIVKLTENGELEVIREA